MGKVDCFELSGLKMTFNSSDHLPEHFHVRKPGSWEVRVFFLLCTEDQLVYEVKWGGEPARRDKQSVLEGVLSHRVELLTEWETKVLQNTRVRNRQ